MFAFARIARPLAVAALGLSLSLGGALAHGYKVGTLEIGHPWTRATPPGASVAGGFLKITNTGKEADRLIGGSFEVSKSVEVHEMAVVDGIMKMRMLDKGLEIAPGATVELKPGGYHVMFIGLTRGPVQGEKIKGTLTFEKAGTVEIEYAVDAVGATHSGH